METSQQHWEHVYRTKQPDQVSWYAEHLNRSLELIVAAATGPQCRIIDVGGGESTLVDDLLDAGYRHVSVLDLSDTALAVTRDRLGQRQHDVTWHTGNVTTVALPESHFDVWHDRAVFHFLTDPADRAAYVAQVRRAVKPGGHVIVATFGPAGPLQCSGLDTVRYSADELHGQFGSQFQLLRHTTEDHITPWGAQQQFTYCYCRVAG